MLKFGFFRSRPIQCLFLACSFTLTSTHVGLAQNQRTFTKVLFVGNSYIFMNNLPGTLEALAKADGKSIYVDTAANPGWKLIQHTKSKQTIAKIGRKNWDYVILQEQSVLPAYAASRKKNMLPAVRSLDKKIKATGGKTVMFMTWGRRDGLKDSQFANFIQMQSALYEGYMEAGRDVDAMIAPVGLAFAKVLDTDVYLPLYQGDGSHPSEAGTYLAACVFYCVIFNKSPVGINYTGGIGPSKARFLQNIAADTVFTDQHKWNLE